MSKKLDPKIVEEVMRKAFLLPLEEYPGAQSKWKCKCEKCGQTVFPLYTSVQQGRGGCKFCARNLIKANDAILTMKKAFLIPLEPFKTANAKWKCKCEICNRISSPSYSTIARGSKCAYCSKVKVDEEQAIKLMISKKLQPLEGFPGSDKKWKCNCLVCGKNISTRYSTIKSGGGGGCIYCKGNKISSSKSTRSIKDLELIANQRQGQLVSKVYLRATSKYEWMCSEGHTWKTTIDKIINRNQWCPYCSNHAPRDIAELSDIAKRRGGALLDHVYQGVEYKYSFSCSNGHKFKNSFNRIENGRWCPRCSNRDIQEELCRVAFEQIFETPFPKVRPKWLRNIRGNIMELDGFSEELGIAFEYQGIQHFSEQRLLTGRHGLAGRIADDLEKADLCKKKGINLFIITHEMKHVNFKEEIKKQAILFQLNLATSNFHDEIDFDKAYIREDVLARIKSNAEKQGLVLLTETWFGNKHKYKMKCSAEGHNFTKPGQAIIGIEAKFSCPKCPKETSPWNIGNLNEISKFAKSKKGELLSSVYVRQAFNYQFRCENGHVFDANFSYLKQRVYFCPVCRKENR